LNLAQLSLVDVRGVGVPVPQDSVPKERKPIFKSISIDVFEMIEISHTNLLWVPDSKESETCRGQGSRVLAFLGTVNPLGFLVLDVPKSRFQGMGTRT